MRKRDIALALGALTTAAAAEALAVAGAALEAAAETLKKMKHDYNTTEGTASQPETPDCGRKAYFTGESLSSLAGAAYLIKDCNMNGADITIYEGIKEAKDSISLGNPTDGFICKPGGILNKKTYENFWELFSTIPSIESEGKSVTEEIFHFNRLHPIHPEARLIDKNGKIVDSTNMGFNLADRKALGKLLLVPEDELDEMTIEQWFADTPHFFETNFWYMWSTTFAFQKQSSLLEFKRYMERMIFAFPKLETLEGIARIPYTPYESVILPLKAYLKEKGVNFVTNGVVSDLDFEDGDGITVTAIHLNCNGENSIIPLSKKDICFMDNACMFDIASQGNLHTPAPYLTDKPLTEKLWTKIAAKKENLGNPESFWEFPDQTALQSFTVTCKGNTLLKLIENYSGNIPGSGSFMTFKDSNWLMSIEVVSQPHFKNQSLDTTVLLGYGININETGNYVQKAMKDCNGEEILTELIHQLHMEDKLEDIKAEVINVIPCIMPYADAAVKPRKMADRPQVVPEGSVNFAMIGQFVEIPEDIALTEEYSVRSARTAVYSLMGVTHKKICPVTPYKKNPAALAKALDAAYR